MCASNHFKCIFKHISAPSFNNTPNSFKWVPIYLNLCTGMCCCWKLNTVEKMKFEEIVSPPIHSFIWVRSWSKVRELNSFTVGSILSHSLGFARVWSLTSKSSSNGWQVHLAWQDQKIFQLNFFQCLHQRLICNQQTGGRVGVQLWTLGKFILRTAQKSAEKIAITMSVFTKVQFFQERRRKHYKQALQQSWTTSFQLSVW